MTIMKALYYFIIITLFFGASNAQDLDAEKISKEASSSVMLVLSEKNGEVSSLGTGFVVSENGLLITNFHVIDKADMLSVKSFTGGTYKVTDILAKDEKRDIAILKIAAKKLPILELADSDLVKQGMPIAVLGNPDGLEGTLSAGIVSATRNYEPFGSVIQITAPISPGSSGSPILNKDAKVIGMATFGRVEGQALNFGIPSNAINELLIKAQKIESETPESKQSSSRIYIPDSEAQGSKEQDQAIMKDSRFIRLKTHEKNSEFFPMLSIAKTIIKEYPNSALAHRVLSDAYYYTDLTDDALKTAKKAIDLDPENARGWNNLAILYSSLERYGEAIDIYTHAIKIAPDDIKLLIEYADMVSSNNISAAKSALKHAQDQLISGSNKDLEIENYNLHVEIVYTYRSMSAYADAYEAAKELKTKFPSDGAIWLAFADAALNNEKFSEVLPAAQKAYRLDSKTAVRGNQIYANAEFLQGKFTSAERAFKNAYSLDRTNIATIEGLIDCILVKQKLVDSDIDLLSKYANEIFYIDEERGKEVDKRIKQDLSGR
jgi:tetratricopeptide (TPR) repeat protein